VDVVARAFSRRFFLIRPYGLIGSFAGRGDELPLGRSNAGQLGFVSSCVGLGRISGRARCRFWMRFLSLPSWWLRRTRPPPSLIFFL